MAMARCLVVIWVAMEAWFGDMVVLV